MKFPRTSTLHVQCNNKSVILTNISTRTETENTFLLITNYASNMKIMYKTLTWKIQKCMFTFSVFVYCFEDRKESYTAWHFTSMWRSQVCNMFLHSSNFDIHTFAASHLWGRHHCTGHCTEVLVSPFFGMCPPEMQTMHETTINNLNFHYM